MGKLFFYLLKYLFVLTYVEDLLCKGIFYGEDFGGELGMGFVIMRYRLVEKFL